MVEANLLFFSYLKTFPIIACSNQSLLPCSIRRTKQEQAWQQKGELELDDTKNVESNNNEKDIEIDKSMEEVKESDDHDPDQIVEVTESEEKKNDQAGSSSSAAHYAWKEYEKKALLGLRSKLEEAILGNKIFKEEKKSDNNKPEDGETASNNPDKGKKEASSDEQSETEKTRDDEAKEDHIIKQEDDDDNDEVIKEKRNVEVDEDISLWGVPLLPSKGDERTNVVLFKFLKARDLYVNEAFSMLKNTLQWRKDNDIDSILDEDFDFDSDYAAYMEGKDCGGRPVCYNIFGVLNDDDLYEKMLGSEEKRQKFLRWRIQLMERGIKQLDLKPGPDGKSTILQINDLKLTPGPMKKELRQTTSKAVELLQDNYPELVSKNIFINVPFWYYAFSALLSPFLTQMTKDKFVYARSSKVIDTLIKYIPGEEIPVQYGGLKRKSDEEFSVEDRAKEVTLKPGATEMIEIPLEEAGSTLVWDVSVGGWEVEYKEEFVPSDDKSYTLIVQKGRKMTWVDEPVRNSFTNKEPGKLVITIDNSSYKKKIVLYRYKTKPSP